MTGLDIEAIRGRARIAASVADALPPIGQEAVAATVDAVGALIDALVEEQTVHAKTFDNFEAMAESSLEFRTRQLDRYARLEAECDRLRAELRELKELCGATAEARDEARADYRTASAALADALQVIADLRGETS